MSKLTAHPGIVAGVDGSPGSKAAVQWAARDAELRNVPLALVHVLSAPAGTWLASSLAPAWPQRERQRAQEVLDDAIRLAHESCEGRGPTQVYGEMPCARTVPALVERSRNADLVVVGCLGTGTLRGRHLGSVSSGLVYHAECPVAVIHDGVQADPDATPAPVLVGIDGSPHSESAIAIAFDEASRRRVGLTALHAWPDVGVLDAAVSLPGPGWKALRAEQDEILSERLAGWSERYPDVCVTKVVARDNAAHQLVESAGSAQLVVVGSRGSGGFAGMLLGSVSAAVMLLAHVPVIVARNRA
jgi:nucleotide-binding universal stress UspA family protein